MSDQSSDSTTELDGGINEPSMEDILASIRKIIAEDDVVDDTHLDADMVVADTNPADSLSSDPLSIPQRNVPVRAEDSIFENSESNFDDLGDVGLESLSSEDSVMDLTEIIEIEDDGEPTAPSDFNPVSDVMSKLESELEPVDDINIENSGAETDNVAAIDDRDLVFSNDDLEVDNLEEIDENGNVSFTTIEAEVLTAYDSLGDTEEDDTVEIVDSIDGAQSESDDVLEIQEFNAESESDLDLVKSLMADLTDTTFLNEDDDPEEETNAEISYDTESDPEENGNSPDASVEGVKEFDLELDGSSDSLEEVELASENTEQEQILNDILDLAKEGQEEQNVGESLDLTIDEPLKQAASDTGAEHDDNDDNSLLQIAAQAEAEAGQSRADTETADEDTDIANMMEELLAPEEAAAAGKDDVLSEFDLALAEEISADPLDDLIATETELPDNSLITENQETENMAKTARKETILDEVTETASADAFASLSQAVEDKAVITESGPRIGDLVQDALRPMLKVWLDENLKGIVERAVAKEVKRISSGK
ncbi:MAG: DUF2497 domain-containing protein [Hellea sp.]|nr:DUF2497 domain-containing protein [Hellea sp.]